MNKISSLPAISFGDTSIPGDVALEICARSCFPGGNFVKISQVNKAFLKMISSDQFWKRLWELYAAIPALNRLCTIIRQQFDPATSLRKAVFLLKRCMKESILAEGAWQKVFTNENKTIDVKLAQSSCVIVQELPSNTSGLTALKNPHLQFLPSFPSALTYVTVADTALQMLPPLQDLIHLTTLIVGGSKLTQVCLSNLPSLERAALGGNLITVFTVKDCPKLKEVNLEDNQLKQVPPTLADLPALEELKLAKNLITEKPEWLQKIKNVFFDKSYAIPKTSAWTRLKKICLG